jgi:hypothetical protein
VGLIMHLKKTTKMVHPLTKVNHVSNVCQWCILLAYNFSLCAAKTDTLKAVESEVGNGVHTTAQVGVGEDANEVGKGESQEVVRGSLNIYGLSPKHLEVDKESWEKHAEEMGFDMEWCGKMITFEGKQWMLCGLDPEKNVCVIKHTRQDTKNVTLEDVKKCMGVPVLVISDPSGGGGSLTRTFTEDIVRELIGQNTTTSVQGTVESGYEDLDVNKDSWNEHAKEMGFKEKWCGDIIIFDEKEYKLCDLDVDNKLCVIRGIINGQRVEHKATLDQVKQGMKYKKLLVDSQDSQGTSNSNSSQNGKLLCLWTLCWTHNFFPVCSRIWRWFTRPDRSNQKIT